MAQDFTAFIQELSGFAKNAENTLNQIEDNGEHAKKDFDRFFQQMIAIRGTADQLNLPQISRIAGLGEEISVKAASITKGNQIKKCVSSLWDALTTVKYMLEHPTEETTEEQKILTHRLESILRQLGGPRPTIDADEIARLLRSRG